MFKGRIKQDGTGLEFSDYEKRKLKFWMLHNPNTPFQLVPTLPESDKQRGWFEGGLCPLVAFYHEGLDHRNYKDVKKVREWLKVEFNSEIISLFGKTHKIAKSTKNQLNSGFLERVVDYLIENYAPPIEALDTKKYKHWHDAIFPYGGPDNYIDYLLEVKILSKNKMDDKDLEKIIDADPADYGSEREGPNYALAQDEE